MKFVRSFKVPLGDLEKVVMNINHHQSSKFLLNENQLLHIYRNPVEYYASNLILPQINNLEHDKGSILSVLEEKFNYDIIGVNLFDEILSEHDFKMHLGSKKYDDLVAPHIKDKNFKLTFYSKRLNIALFYYQSLREDNNEL
jgi:hypothetical protein